MEKRLIKIWRHYNSSTLDNFKNKFSMYLQNSSFVNSYLMI